MNKLKKKSPTEKEFHTVSISIEERYITLNTSQMTTKSKISKSLLRTDTTMKEIKVLHLTQLPSDIVQWVLYKATTQQLIILGDLIDHTLKPHTTREEVIT